MSDTPSYKHTMNLPRTSFKMKAGLAQREPERLKRWEDAELYHQMLAKNEGRASYVLHDGPPYANGPIHIGHALNKVLKDVIVKYHTMRGYYSPYVPGWDCHGLPIENKVEEELGPDKMRAIDTPTFRRICREYAEKQLDGQRTGFKRLGVTGEWDDPYLTFTPEYEAGNIRVFKKLYDAGAIYQGRKPIHWCSHCHTALAEAELEYSDETSPAIFVRFAVTTTIEGLEEWAGRLDVAIWTTTPWTLPANQAVILHPEARYVAVICEGRAILFAEELAESCCEKFGWEASYATSSDGGRWSATGEELVGNRYAHPIFGDAGEEGQFIYADYVTLDDGTGIVHSAPGHGADDYAAGLKFDIPMVMPVADDGTFYEGEGLGSGGPWGGMKLDDANPRIVSWLDSRGALIAHEDITHSYPHCWRCHEPVIFRATTQWFVSMDATGLREGALMAIRDDVEWIPSWAANRIGSMVADRPDWCISRQRYWGVPIPVFYCRDCGGVVACDESFDAVIELFEREGADAWYSTDPLDILPESVCCPNCGGRNLERGADVLDVWWESGVSHTSVLEPREQLSRPADLYLEGSDQHRGWFHSALLTSVGAYGVAPYKAVMSCGFINDAEGRKMSKSLGNVIDPNEVCDTLGADVLRLWVGSVDYSQDMGVGPETLQRTSEAYRRIRNTFRYLLGNLDDFSLADCVGAGDLEEIDAWALARLARLTDEVGRHYDEYHFHSAYRALYDFIVSISSEYFDAIKDRLYSEAASSPRRRSAQTVLAGMLDVLVRLFAPILVFTCDEVWEKYPAGMVEDGRPEFVHLLDWPTSADLQPALSAERTEGLLADWAVVMQARDAVTKALEEQIGAAGSDGAADDGSGGGSGSEEAAGAITKSQAASVVLRCDGETARVLEACGRETLAEAFIVADVTVEVDESVEGISASVSPAPGEKCPRCWMWRELGDDGLCPRCHEVLSEL